MASSPPSNAGEYARRRPCAESGAAPLRRLAIDGTTLAYAEHGEPDAEPIVLLHGYLGSRLTWRHQIPALAATHRVLALDWFGWGDSGRSLALDYSYDSEVERLERVLEALGVAACNLFGMDYGGFLALGLCARRPPRVTRLALLASRAHRTFTPRWRLVFGAMHVAARLPLLRSAMLYLPHTAIHRRSVARELRRGVFDAACFEHYAGWMSATRDGSRFLRRFFNHYRAAARADLDAALPTIGCPTAVIWGRDDPFLSADIASDLAARIPRARLTMLDATGHFVSEERPAEVHQALADLLAS